MKFLILGLIPLLLIIPGNVLGQEINSDIIPFETLFPNTVQIGKNWHELSSSTLTNPLYYSEHFYQKKITNFEVMEKQGYVNEDKFVLVIIAFYDDESTAKIFFDSLRTETPFPASAYFDSPKNCVDSTYINTNFESDNSFTCLEKNFLFQVRSFTNTNRLDGVDTAEKFIDSVFFNIRHYGKSLLEAEKTFLQIKNDLDIGDLYQLSDRNIANFPTVSLHEQDNFDLLEIQFDYEIEETFDTNTGIPFKTLLATNTFSLDYDSWPKYSRIHSDEYLVLGTIIPGTDDWNVDCPSYFGKVINPNIPYGLKSCFEIPKNTNYFVFEGAVFSKEIVTTIEEINEITKTDNTNLESELTSSLDSISESSVIVEPVAKQNPTNSGGGCLIATATYGSELTPEVQKLRELRDNSLLQTESGTSFINSFNEIYYSFSPIIADYERENPIFKEMVKLFITPMITSLSILNYVEMDSEESVLGYGISLIVLNGLMYVGIPILAVMRFRK
jgi:hypothetical protein